MAKYSGSGRADEESYDLSASVISFPSDWTHTQKLPAEPKVREWASLFLVSPSEHDTSFIDIVFVHQIGGNPRASWKAANGSGLDFFWPEYISTWLPEARIWSFGFPRGEKIVLRDVARALCVHLGEVRRKDAEAAVITSTDVPKIIFIAAGIGGIIVKEALLDCRGSNSGPHLSIWKGCVGIIFLGTPHSDCQDHYRPFARYHGFIIDSFNKNRHGQYLAIDNEAIVDDMKRINKKFLDAIPAVPKTLSVVNSDAPEDPLAPDEDNGLFPNAAKDPDQFDSFTVTRKQVFWYAFRDPNDVVLLKIKEKMLDWRRQPLGPREAGLRLLSLDGGGVRGLCSLLILNRIMDRVRDLEAKKNNASPLQLRLPCDYFELGGGTSTGGLIAIMLFRLRMDTQAAIREYKLLAPKIFKWNLLSLPMAAFSGAIFSGDVLEQEIKGLVGAQLSQEEKDILGQRLPNAPLRPAIDILRGLKQGRMFVSALLVPEEPLRLRNYWPFDQRPRFGDCTIWEAARATSAAPFYFPPAHMSGLEFWDGGLQNNNPIDEVDDERRDLWPLRKVACIISIGTGNSTHASSSGLSAFTKFKVLLHNLTNTESRHRNFVNKMKKERIDYFRFNPTTAADKIGLADYGMMNKLEEYTEEYLRIEEVQSDIQRCAELLVSRRVRG